MAMIRAQHPNVGDVVMAEVRSISQHKDKAVVHLIEYDVGATLISLDAHPGGCLIEPVEVGRIEPVITVRRRVRRGRMRIEVSRNVPAGGIYACEGRFAMRKHVRDVLSFVAERLGRDIDFVCSYLDWPESVHDLENLILDGHVSPALRFYLSDSLMCMRLFSVKIENPHLLAPTWWYQNGWCWAVGLIRQFEALLKQNGQLEPDVFLSVQDLINLIPLTDRGFDDGVDGFLVAKEALTVHGVTTVTFCPFGSTQRLPGAPVYKLGSLKIDRQSENSLEDWDELIDENLHIGGGLPVASALLWYPSYMSNADEVLYRATDDEIHDEESKNLLPVHVMILSSTGTDRNGDQFLEFQETTGGDLEGGDRGYYRFARYPCPLFEMAYMTLLPHQ